MTLGFLGTGGEIEARTRRHNRHSATLVSYRKRAVLIDCGLDWRRRLDRIRPEGIVLTHAHPDHAGGLRDGAPCSVNATEKTWDALRRWPVGERREVMPNEPFTLAGIRFEAFTVEHSIRARAVGYRIEAAGRRSSTRRNLVSIDAERASLAESDLYVGNGAAISRRAQTVFRRFREVLCDAC